MGGVVAGTERRVMTDRRRGRTRFHVPERRTGFDRRLADGSRAAWHRGMASLRDAPGLVAAIVAAVVVLGLGAGTYLWWRRRKKYSDTAVPTT